MRAKSEARECHCEMSAAAMLRGRDSNGGGNGSNENSAVMRHGSYVRIGCFKCLFRYSKNRMMRLNTNRYYTGAGL